MKAKIRRTMVASLAALFLVGCKPELSNDAVRVHSASSPTSPLAITGKNFGAAGANAYLEIAQAGGSPLAISSQSSDIIAWEDKFIMMRVNNIVTPTSVRVHNADGWSATSATVKNYEVDF